MIDTNYTNQVLINLFKTISESDLNEDQKKEFKKLVAEVSYEKNFQQKQTLAEKAIKFGWKILEVLSYVNIG